MPSRRSLVIIAVIAAVVGVAVIVVSTRWSVASIEAKDVSESVHWGESETAAGSASPLPQSPVPTPTSFVSAPPAGQLTAQGSGPGGSLQYTGTDAVALTFDDGPDPIYTPKLLKILRDNNVKATFCLVGFRVRDHPDLVRQIVAEGHTLCNHSWKHLFDLGKRGLPYMQSDLQSTNDAIHAAAPGAAIRYFRAPGGNFTPELVRVARNLGMAPLYWHVDPRDWESTKYGTGQSMVNHIISVVSTQTRSGSIVLSHDNAKPDTIRAYETLIPELKARFRLEAL